MSEDVKANNPAGRLYHALRKAQRSDDDTEVRQVWANVFDADPDDRARLLSGISTLTQQIQEARRALELHGSLTPSYAEPLDELERAFSVINLTQGPHWRGWEREHLGDETLTKLQYVALELQRHYPERSVEEEELAALREEVEVLLSEVRKASLPDELRRVLLDALEHVRTAIVEYDLRGDEGLRRALEQYAGIGIIHRDRLEDARVSHEPLFDHLGQMLRLLLAAVDVGIQVGDKLRPETVEGLLTP